jgi:FO synthase
MSRVAIEDVAQAALAGLLPDAETVLRIGAAGDLAALTAAAARLRDAGHGDLVSYSRKVFIPLTKLCRDVCHYCTFAHPPKRGERCYLTPEEAVAIAAAGKRAGCREALFTLGDKPEARYRAARAELDALGCETTVDYLVHVSRIVLEETGLLPHANPGVMTAEEIRALRTVSVSQGIMLETTSERLSARGGPHFGSPDKVPAVRLETIAEAGKARVPFTSGILIGIGETRAERLEALLALRDLNAAHGHIQEIIVQNFRAKPGTRMVDAPEPPVEELQWTIAMARLVFGPAMNIQAPPNLSPGMLGRLIASGLNDWGGVSPVTPDHVNPEAPWPELVRLAEQTEAAGKVLVERLAIYPDYVRDRDRWVDPGLVRAVNQHRDAGGFAREADGWATGAADVRLPGLPQSPRAGARPSGVASLEAIIGRAEDGCRLGEDEITRLFGARGAEAGLVVAAADRVRRRLAGDVVTYVVNRNINYTNVCGYRCQFCAFSKGKMSENLRGKPYVLDLDEIERRVREAWERGGTEVCLQGGIHPAYTGRTYLDICHRIKQALPDMHIHAFSPLEVWQGAQTLGVSLSEFLADLKAAGLSSLPGTAAEILDDDVRAVICPDKINTAEWLEVMETAHGLGLRSTATIMFGHVEGPQAWARHLTAIRDLQARTGGFTEFVPLPFVAHEAPIYLKGRARPGPTWREAILMHAAARLVLNPVIANIQTSWVKMGPEGALLALQAGANDLGGTLMNETITRSAGAQHGQELPPEEMDRLILSIGREPRQRRTLYHVPEAERVAASYDARPLTEAINQPAKEYAREGTTG